MHMQAGENPKIKIQRDKDACMIVHVSPQASLQMLKSGCRAQPEEPDLRGSDA